MVKRTFKRIVSVLLSLAILAPCLMAFPVKALTYNTVSIKSNMSREECWIEAGKYDYLDMSRQRIAVEFYYWSQKKQQIDDATQSWYDMDLITGGVCVLGVAMSVGIGFFSPPAGAALKLAVGAGCSVTGSGLAIGTIVVADNQKKADRAFQAVKIGNDSLTFATEDDFYSMWYNEAGSPIRSALNTNKVIDISGNSNENGAKVQLWSDNGTGAQKFYILRTGDDNWCNIFKAGTFKCLDVTSGKAGKGVKIQLWNYNGTAAQDWKLENAGNGYVYLKNRLGYYLDVSGGSSADGTQIQTWTLNKTKAQKWKVA